jgi:hypothetical protein
MPAFTTYFLPIPAGAPQVAIKSPGIFPVSSSNGAPLRRWLAIIAVGWTTTLGLRADPVLVPQVTGEWWTVAGDPDLGKYTDPKQQPVDFAVWQAGDGTWQLWSCIRATQCGGKTRLFHRWEGNRLADVNWTPTGIAMEARPEYGETSGGLQAPHVVKINGLYHMFYGDWENICVATSKDGKEFARRLNANGKAGMFTEGTGNNTRDAMAIQIKGVWHCYYTAFPKRQGAVYCRTSKDTRQWSESKIAAFGGEAGTNAYSAECPFVLELSPGEYYLFRTQRYGKEGISRIYHSHDPMDFGIDRDEKFLVGNLPVAAPEIFRHAGQYYIASLLPNLKGIRMARMEWVRKQ